MIDSKVMKYIPAKLQNRVTSCDRFERETNKYTYNVNFDYESDVSEGETAIFADSVEGLRWACKEALNGRRGVIYG